MIQHDVLFKRHPANPIITAKNWPFSIESIFNDGPTHLTDGSALLMCRVEDRRSHSHLCAARSIDGIESGIFLEAHPLSWIRAPRTCSRRRLSLRLYDRSRRRHQSISTMAPRIHALRWPTVA
jgi:hypothetical protein